MSALTDSARGKECLIRLPGICNGNSETVVATHARLAGTCGVGMKPPDTNSARGCSACHDEVDRRTRFLESDFVRLLHLEGVLRTLDALAHEGWSMVRKR
jgi:hypothetical protein